MHCYYSIYILGIIIIIIITFSSTEKQAYFSIQGQLVILKFMFKLYYYSQWGLALSVDIAVFDLHLASLDSIPISQASYYHSKKQYHCLVVCRVFQLGM